MTDDDVKVVAVAASRVAKMTGDSADRLGCARSLHGRSVCGFALYVLLVVMHRCGGPKPPELRPDFVASLFRSGFR